MRKILKRWGDSLVIRFSNEDEKIFHLKEGDEIVINDKDLINSIIELKKDEEKLKCKKK